MKKLNLKGLRFGKLTVVGFFGSVRTKTGKRTHWECLCDCGREITVLGASLVVGNTTSCGCFALEMRTTHGKSKSAEYRTWWSLICRCKNKNSMRYEDYGGRGISVCERWLRFENFFEDMGERPSKQHSIDRIDNNGGYAPDNCRCATRSQQQNNRRPIRPDSKHKKGKDHWAYKKRIETLHVY